MQQAPDITETLVQWLFEGQKTANATVIVQLVYYCTYAVVLPTAIYFMELPVGRQVSKQYGFPVPAHQSYRNKVDNPQRCMIEVLSYNHHHHHHHHHRYHHQ